MILTLLCQTNVNITSFKMSKRLFIFSGSLRNPLATVPLRPRLQVDSKCSLRTDAAARPQCVVLVEAELQMVRLEAGVDESVLHRLRVEHRNCRWLSFSGKSLAEGWSEPFTKVCRGC